MTVNLTPTLASFTRVILFGKTLTDVTPGVGAGDHAFAKIYGFSYEGHYYDMSKPAIFRVENDKKIPDVKALYNEREVIQTGFIGDWASFAKDLEAWGYDKDDKTIRLDVVGGTLEDILVEDEAGGGKGSHAGASKAHAGASKAHAGASMTHMRGHD